MDRPSRKTRVKSYYDPQDFGDDDDEDFAEVKAPPSKKTRENVKQHTHKKSSSKSSSQELDCRQTGSQNSRALLDEKFLERDLEAALTLSMLQTTDRKGEQSVNNKDVKGQAQSNDENTDPRQHLSNCTVDINLMGLDKITHKPGSSCSISRERKAPSKDNEDVDYIPKQTTDAESDEDFSAQSEREDEEFTVQTENNSNKKCKKKETTTNKAKTKQLVVSKKDKTPSKPFTPQMQATNSLLVRIPSAPVAAITAKEPSTSAIALFKPALSPSSGGCRIPKWTPPGQIGRSPGSSLNGQVKSPGNGLRLGLSRRVRVKPLHPSVSIN